ncbi:MAG TPA: DMT family transporter [Anaerolineales bacterium]
MSKPTLGILSGLAAAGIWGAMYVVSKVVLDIIPPFALITTRLLLGGLTLYLVLRARGPVKISGRDFGRVFGVGVIGYGISLGLQFIGTKMSTAANGALVTSATPAFVLLFAHFLLRERIGWIRLAALLLATIGVVLVIDPRNAGLDASLFWGNIALLGAAVTWALYSVLIRVVTRELDVVLVSLVAFLGGLPISVAGGTAEVLTVGVGQITLWVLAGVLFLGIVCTALAMYLWNNAFALIDAGRASLTFFAQPVVGTLLGWLFLHEQITPLFLFGGLLIAIGLVLASR